MSQLNRIIQNKLNLYLLSLILLAGLFLPAAQAKEKEHLLTVGFYPYPRMVTPVRVGIATRSAQIRVAVWSRGAVFIDNKPIFALSPGSVYSVSNCRVSELGTGKGITLPLNKRALISSSDYRIWANNRWYRGALELILYPHAVTAINVLDLEDYLPGVVPSEMPANWCFEALKAQAVAARSYAWAHLGNGSKWKTEGFDLVPDVRDQCYKGLAAEANSTNYAVAYTRGLILRDAGRVKAGFYRAWVGDAYENLNIRKTSVPEDVLERITSVPKVVGVTVKQWDANGNAHSIQIMGANKKTREVSGVALAKMLHFTTATILDVHQEGSNWIFTYRGPGNGSRGLSQHGANMLAQRGWKCEQILQQYYQDPDGKVRLDYTDNTKLLMYRYREAMKKAADEEEKATKTTTTTTETTTETSEVTANN